MSAGSIGLPRRRMARRTRTLRLAVAAVSIAAALPGYAETPDSPGRSWVFFTDKAVATSRERADALARTRSALGTRCLSRRATRGTVANLVADRDLPVSEGYVAQVQATGAKPVVRSCWLNAISVRATPEQLAAIRALPCVRRVQPVARRHRIEDAAPVSSTTQPTPRVLDPFYGRSFDQLTQIRLTQLHAAGFTGAGIVIGVLDTGFARWHEAFNEPGHPLQVLAEWDFVNNDANAGYDPADPVLPFGRYQHSHGTYILGILASYKPGQLVGAAYDAAYVLAKTEDIANEQPVEEDYYVAGLEFVESHGADLATSSLGYSDWYSYSDMDGETAVTTLAVNIATSNGLICCTASGNGGTDQDEPTLIAPADAFDVITIGAVNASGVLADFSSGGPTFDGRLKPEVLARGEGASSIHDINTTGYVDTLDGTSVSTPQVAGAVACILQAHPTWTLAQVRQNLFQTSQDYVVTQVPDPQSHRGYGIIDAFAAADDCNNNGVADRLEIHAGTLQDCNGNNRADNCESLGDFNGDGALSLADAPGFIGCMSGSCTHPPCGAPLYGNACCRLADLDADGDVDLGDYARWIAQFGDGP